jgi:type II secretion system protein N
MISSERLRQVRRWAAFSGAGLVVYIVTLTFCFPYQRAGELVAAMAAQRGYDVEIGESKGAFPFQLALEQIRVTSRTTTPGAKPARTTIDGARVGLVPFLLSRGKKLDLVISGLGGEIAVGAESEKKGPFDYEIRARDIAMARLPGVKEAINLPLGGTLELTLDLQSPSGKFAEASGELSFKCTACVAGDGKTPLKLSGSNPFLAAGLTLPRIRLGDLVGRAQVEKGTAKLQGVQAKSADVEVTLEGEVTLRDPPAYSTVNAYLRFKLGDALLKNAPTLGSMLQMAGGTGRRPDGFYGVRLSGTLSSLNSAFSITSPVAASSGPARGPRPVPPPAIVPGGALRPPTLPVITPPAAPPPAIPPPAAAPEAAPPPPPPPPPAPPAPEQTISPTLRGFAAPAQRAPDAAGAPAPPPGGGIGIVPSPSPVPPAAAPPPPPAPPPPAPAPPPAEEAPAPAE